MLYPCTICGIEKPNTEFYNDSQRPRGFKSACKTCGCAKARASYRTSYRANPQKLRDRAKKWHAENPEKSRNMKLKQYFGITLAQYNELLNLQNGGCAICQKICTSGRALAVDHCHETGHIRGLLCGNCNNALGRLKDSPVNCLAAANYLQQTKQVPIARVGSVDSAGYMSPC